MKSTRLVCRLIDDTVVTLLRPLIGSDFLAGINLTTNRWAIIPLSQIASFEEQRFLIESDYPVNHSSADLSSYLQVMVGQQLLVANAGQVLQAQLAAVQGPFAYLTKHGTNQSLAVNLQRLQQIELPLVENFFAAQSSSGKVAESYSLNSERPS